MISPLSFRGPSRRLLPGLFLAFVITTGLHAAKPAWIKLEADGFVIFSDASEKQVVDCALRYAGYRHVLRVLLLGEERALPPSTLLLFNRDKPFRALMPAEKKGDNTRIVNYTCEVDGTALSTFALDGDRDQALRLTFEFETIWALRRTGHFVPLWMSQGAGEVLCSLRVKPDKGVCIVGEEDGRSFGEAFKWPKFFSITQESSEYHEAKEELSDYLEQAWGLMHWILLQDEHSRERFKALEQQLRREEAMPVLAAVTGKSDDALTKAIRKHMGKTRAIPFDAAGTKARFRITPALEAELLVHQIDVLAAAGRGSDADMKLLAADQMAPNLPVVKEAWARKMLRDGRLREAVDYYRAAIAAGSQNFTAYLRSATLRLDDMSSGGFDRAGEGGNEATDAVNEARRALELNPGSLEGYQALGRALYVLPKLAEDQIAYLDPGAVRGNEGALVRTYRALLHGRLGHREECARDLRAIIADPMLSNRARAQAEKQLAGELLRMDSIKIEKAVREHDYATALTVIEAGEQEPEKTVAAGYARLRAWVRQAIEHDENATDEDRKRAGTE